MNKKKLGDIVIHALIVLCILAVVMPVIIGAGYTYPCEDDFSWEMGGKILSQEYGGILGALLGTYNYYMNLNGTFLANFLWHFVRPYDRGGMLGFHLVMISLILLLVFAIYYLAQSMVKGRVNGLILALVVYIIMFNTSRLGTEKEFLYWYTGNINYALGTALACITLGVTIRLKNEENPKKARWFAKIGAITGFLASGVSLQVASFNCSWLLLMLVLCYDEVWERKIVALPFGAAFFGALINACAPGYFARINLDHGEAEYGIVELLRDTLICWKQEWSIVTGTKFLIVLLLGVFVICCVCKMQIFLKGISTWQLLLLFPAMFLIQYLCALPVVLGYQSSDLIFSRTICTYELVTKLTLLFLTMSFAQWLREHVKVTTAVYSGIALVLMVGIIFSGSILDEIKQGYSYNLAKELRRGEIQELYEYRERILGLLENSEKGTDVYLKVPSVPSSKVMYSMGLTTDPSTCNSHAAIYFGLKSLTVEYSDEYEFPIQ